LLVCLGGGKGQDGLRFEGHPSEQQSRACRPRQGKARPIASATYPRFAPVRDRTLGGCTQKKLFASEQIASFAFSLTTQHPMASRRSLCALSGLQAEASLCRNASRQSFALGRQTTRQSSSTSAIAYKALHRRIQPLPAAAAAPSVSPAAAVSSILYETPLPSQSPRNRHILNCLVQNEPGVLSRVSGILAARGFNIDSLVVCSTEVADLSRMTIVLQGQDGVVEQARRQLEDLVPVWAVLDYTTAPLVQRELLLAKVSILGPEYFEELLAHHREMTDADAWHNSTATEDMTPEELEQHNSYQQQVDYHPRNLAPSEALRLKNQHLEHITHLTHQFGGKVLDISTNNCIVEVSAKPSRIDSFMKLIAPFGILESARTGESSRNHENSITLLHTLIHTLQVLWPFPVRPFTALARSKRRMPRMLSTRALFLPVKPAADRVPLNIPRMARLSHAISSVPAFSVYQGGERYVV
jgi:acetolactate synthase-1/3 small subunit